MIRQSLFVIRYLLFVVCCLLFVVRDVNCELAHQADATAQKFTRLNFNLHEAAVSLSDQRISVHNQGNTKSHSHAHAHHRTRHFISRFEAQAPVGLPCAFVDREP